MFLVKEKMHTINLVQKKEKQLDIRVDQMQVHQTKVMLLAKYLRN